MVWPCLWQGPNGSPTLFAGYRPAGMRSASRREPAPPKVSPVVPRDLTPPSDVELPRVQIAARLIRICNRAPASEGRITRLQLPAQSVAAHEGRRYHFTDGRGRPRPGSFSQFEWKDRHDTCGAVGLGADVRADRVEEFWPTVDLNAPDLDARLAQWQHFYNWERPVAAAYDPAREFILPREAWADSRPRPYSNHVGRSHRFTLTVRTRGIAGCAGKLAGRSSATSTLRSAFPPVSLSARSAGASTTRWPAWMPSSNVFSKKQIRRHSLAAV